jgi:hypothetical protein
LEDHAWSSNDELIKTVAGKLNEKIPRGDVLNNVGKTKHEML